MNNINKILNNIMTEALEQSKGKDKELIEEAMKTLNIIDKIPEETPSPEQTFTKILDNFTETVQKIKEK